MILKRTYRQSMRTAKLLAVEFLLKAIDLGLRRTSYRRVYRVLLFLSPEPKPVHDFPRSVALARLVNFVAIKPHIQATCLRRSLLLWWLLRWKRIPSEVRLGMGLGGGHAWVEHDSKVINDRPNIYMNYPIRYSADLTPEQISSFDT